MITMTVMKTTTMITLPSSMAKENHQRLLQKAAMYPESAASKAVQAMTISKRKVRDAQTAEKRRKSSRRKGTS